MRLCVCVFVCLRAVCQSWRVFHTHLPTYIGSTTQVYAREWEFCDGVGPHYGTLVRRRVHDGAHRRHSARDPFCVFLCMQEPSHVFSVVFKFVYEYKCVRVCSQPQTLLLLYTAVVTPVEVAFVSPVPLSSPVNKILCVFAVVHTLTHTRTIHTHTHTHTHTRTQTHTHTRTERERERERHTHRTHVYVRARTT